ncbi:hypothetical protein Tco_1569713 [Tanacetum coccineum]
MKINKKHFSVSIKGIMVELVWVDDLLVKMLSLHFCKDVILLENWHGSHVSFVIQQLCDEDRIRHADGKVSICASGYDEKSLRQSQ